MSSRRTPRKGRTPRTTYNERTTEAKVVLARRRLARGLPAAAMARVYGIAALDARRRAKSNLLRVFELCLPNPNAIRGEVGDRLRSVVDDIIDAAVGSVMAKLGRDGEGA